jgi:hypothetical protein
MYIIIGRYILSFSLSHWLDKKCEKITFPSMDMKTRGCSQEKMGGLGWLLLENEVEDTHTKERGVYYQKYFPTASSYIIPIFERRGEIRSPKRKFQTDENKINV